MKVALAFPNKPLKFKSPSGDRTIAHSIVLSFERYGHIFREMTDFRSRWFWMDVSTILKLPRVLLETVRNYRSFAPDVWITYHSYYKSPDLFGWWLAAPSIPYVLIQPMRAKKRLKRTETKIGAVINDMAIRRADLLITNNLRDVDSLRAFVPDKKLVYVPPGVFPEEFTRDPESANYLRSKLILRNDIYILLTVSRFRKGVKWQSLVFLFEALSVLVRKRDFLLIVIGSGPLENHVKAMAHKLLHDRVVFLGEIDRSKLAPYYSLADIFVFPGIGESLGMVYLEAQSCGCPVVALDSDGVRQVVCHKKTGILVSVMDPVAYADAIDFLLANPELRKEMGGKAIQFIRQERNAHINNGHIVKLVEELVKSKSKNAKF